jgi:hypothetical protein
MEDGVCECVTEDLLKMSFSSSDFASEKKTNERGRPAHSSRIQRNNERRGYTSLCILFTELTLGCVVVRNPLDVLLT